MFEESWTIDANVALLGYLSWFNTGFQVVVIAVKTFENTLHFSFVVSAM